jgi:hypothetical protein
VSVVLALSACKSGQSNDQAKTTEGGATDEGVTGRAAFASVWRPTVQ